VAQTGNREQVGDPFSSCSALNSVEGRVMDDYNIDDKEKDRQGNETPPDRSGNDQWRAEDKPAAQSVDDVTRRAGWLALGTTGARVNNE